MKTSYLVILCLLSVQLSLNAQTLPDDAEELIRKRQEVVAKIDKTLNRELEKVKKRCTKAGDLDGAIAVDALIKSPGKGDVGDESDPLLGTVWNFLGVNRQKINEFTFPKGGKVRCENSYKDATWRRLDDDNILFSYGTDASFIIFRLTDPKGKSMSGHHYSGRRRHLQITK